LKESDVAMKRESRDLVRGGGNVLRDLGQDNADAEQWKAILARSSALDRERLTVRAAHDCAGMAAADFAASAMRTSVGSSSIV